MNDHVQRVHSEQSNKDLFIIGWIPEGDGGFNRKKVNFLHSPQSLIGRLRLVLSGLLSAHDRLSAFSTNETLNRSWASNTKPHAGVSDKLSSCFLIKNTFLCLRAPLELIIWHRIGEMFLLKPRLELQWLTESVKPWGGWTWHPLCGQTLPYCGCSVECVSHEADGGFSSFASIWNSDKDAHQSLC